MQYFHHGETREAWMVDEAPKPEAVWAQKAHTYDRA